MDGSAGDWFAAGQGMEMHRSSSGRHFQLKQLVAADEAQWTRQPFTPRASSGPRPGNKQRVHSTEWNNHRNDDDLRQRRNSFSLSTHVFTNLERVRSSTESKGQRLVCEEQDHCGKCSENRADNSSEERENMPWDTRDDIASSRLEDQHFCIPAPPYEEIQMEESKTVASFGLWGRAVKTNRLPDAIIFTKANRSKPSSPDSHDDVSLLALRRVEAAPTTVPSVSEMVSQLHVTHPHLAALALVSGSKAMALTRSTSPRIRRRGFSSVSSVDVSFERNSDNHSTSGKLSQY